MFWRLRIDWQMDKCIQERPAHVKEPNTPREVRGHRQQQRARMFAMSKKNVFVGDNTVGQPFTSDHSN